MAKRIILALLLVTLAAGGTFAQVQLSAGFGGNFAFGIDSAADDYSFYYLAYNIGGGFYVFFDADYVEADVGMLFGYQSHFFSYGHKEIKERIDVTYLTLGLYGKYPIYLGGFTLSPMLGVQFDVGLNAKNVNGDDVVFGDQRYKEYYMLYYYFNRLWVKLGVGADFNLSDMLYLRPSVLYGINFGTKWVRNQEELVDSFFYGLDIRVALGFRF